MFPSYLTVNELLRLRRVCRGTKDIAEEYLRRHPRSCTEVSLLLIPGDKRELRGFQSVEAFLQNDRSSTIQQPTTRFSLLNSFPDKKKSVDSLFRSPQLNKVLESYATQMVHLTVWRMNLPLGRNEIQFYERLPNLRSLRILVMVAKCEGDKSVSPSFPQPFANLRRLKIQNFEPRDRPFATELLCGLVQYCRKLEHYNPPFLTHPSPSALSSIVENGHLKKMALGCFSLASTPENARLKQLFDVLLNHNVKGTHVCTEALNSCEQTTLQTISPHIISLNMENFLHTCLHGVVFPNVEKLSFFEFDYDDDSYNPQATCRLWHLLFPNRFPAVKRVAIGCLDYHSRNDVMQFIWTAFPNLEEIKFLFPSSKFLEDAAFIVQDGESPILQLKSKHDYVH